jgi:diaminopimelate epimerase
MSFALHFGGLDGQFDCAVFVNNQVVFVLEDFEFARVGRQFEHQPFLPRRVNTEFILPFSRDRPRMQVWGCGSGETLACGTASCSALVAAVLTGGLSDGRRWNRAADAGDEMVFARRERSKSRDDDGRSG